MVAGLVRANHSCALDFQDGNRRELAELDSEGALLAAGCVIQ
jgi:hypothetical protein